MCSGFNKEYIVVKENQLVTIEKDMDFENDKYPQIVQFFKNHLLPEMISKQMFSDSAAEGSHNQNMWIKARFVP